MNVITNNMPSIVRRLFNRKRKADKPIDHPRYFYSEFELFWIEKSRILMDIACRSGLTMSEAADAFIQVATAVIDDGQYSNLLEKANKTCVPMSIIPGDRPLIEYIPRSQFEALRLHIRDRSKEYARLSIIALRDRDAPCGKFCFSKVVELESQIVRLIIMQLYHEHP